MVGYFEGQLVFNTDDRISAFDTLSSKGVGEKCEVIALHKVLTLVLFICIEDWTCRFRSLSPPEPIDKHSSHNVQNANCDPSDDFVHHSPTSLRHSRMYLWLYRSPFLSIFTIYVSKPKCHPDSLTSPLTAASPLS